MKSPPLPARVFLVCHMCRPVHQAPSATSCVAIVRQLTVALGALSICQESDLEMFVSCYIFFYFICVLFYLINETFYSVDQCADDI